MSWGNFQLDNNEAEVTISRRNERSQRGFRKSQTETWKIIGILHGDDQAAITAAIQAREAAFAQDGQDLMLLTDSGGSTAHSLSTGNTCGGTFVIDGPNFPQGAGAEYSTFRTWDVTIEAEIPVTQEDLLDWTETISIEGGGPKHVFIQTLTGVAQKQTVAQNTPYRLTQSGSAIGFSGYPIPPGPVFPAHEHRPRRRISRTGPKVRRGKFQDYRINWTYQFEAVTPLDALPTVR